jgi:pSer/pThr/pTyr-binding forkhead associated (FHA) protein
VAYLLITSGPNAGVSFHLKNSPLGVGRDVTRDVQLIDPKVSRKHFRLTRQGEHFLIEEQDAKNGTFVNDSQVKEAQLADGDRIRAGETELLFVQSDDHSVIDTLKQARRLSAVTTAPTVV